MFADLRARRTVDWIKDLTAGATFCKRSDVVKQVKGGKAKPNSILGAEI